MFSHSATVYARFSPSPLVSTITLRYVIIMRYTCYLKILVGRQNNRRTPRLLGKKIYRCWMGVSYAEGNTANGEGAGESSVSERCGVVVVVYIYPLEIKRGDDGDDDDDDRLQFSLAIAPGVLSLTRRLSRELLYWMITFFPSAVKTHKGYV